MAHKVICDDSICSHDGIVGYIASLKDNERNLVKFGKNPNLISRTVFRKEASIDYFVNISNKISFHFSRVSQKSGQLRTKDN